MSAPDDDKNPWISLADLLEGDKNMPVATLANVIERDGIQSYDRFGRRVTFDEANPQSEIIKTRALDMLADHYAFEVGNQDGQDYVPDLADQWDNPFHMHGWPKDEAPDFKVSKAEQLPSAIRKASNVNSEPNPKARRTYLILLAALLDKSKIDLDESGANRRVKLVTETYGYPLSRETIRQVLLQIPEALEFSAT
jgi:hypothetical protein